MLAGSAAVAEGAVMGVGLFYIVAFVIGVTAPDNLTIISMQGAGDLENYNHLVNGVLLLTIGCCPRAPLSVRADSEAWRRLQRTTMMPRIMSG